MSAMDRDAIMRRGAGQPGQRNRAIISIVELDPIRILAATHLHGASARPEHRVADIHEMHAVEIDILALGPEQAGLRQSTAMPAKNSSHIGDGVAEGDDGRVVSQG